MCFLDQSQALERRRSLEGKITVIKSGGGQWEILARTDLGDEIAATPALAGGRLYVRTHEAVWCFK